MATTEFSLGPVTGDCFIGRKKLIQEMANEVSNPRSHTGFCLYGRRRTGKTSALMELRYLLRNRKDVVVAYLSLYDMADVSLKTFGKELVDAVLESYRDKHLLPLDIQIRKLLEAPVGVVIELLKNAKIEAAITEQIRLILEYRQASQNHSEYMLRIFDMGEVLATATKTKCVLILDEFPEILKIENGMQLVKLFRTRHETQKKTVLIISGSIRKTLDMVALSETSPFYKQLVPRHLRPFTEEETRDFLKAYVGRADEATLKQLYGWTGGLPFYLQFIGRSTHYAGNIANAVSQFIEQEGNVFFKEEFEKLGAKEKAIAVSLSGGKQTLTQISRACSEPTTSIGRYLPLLVEKEVITKETRGVYSLVDALFGYWVKRNYAPDD